VRSPTDEAELVRAAAAGEPAADAALWDAYGPAAYAFSHRVLGEPAAAADAAQDAFLIAHAELPRLRREGEGFAVASLRAARTTSFELVGRRPPARPRGRLSGAAARLRPQQRAALALAGLERLSYAEIAAVLGIAVESVSALLARARLRLHDELHGTALAAGAVRSPDCEDVLPLLAAAADGELDAADAGWADPHVERCPACARSVRAMGETAAIYAAWSPAPAPSWLRDATLADVASETTRAPAVSVPARAALPAALLGATVVTGAFAALLVGTAQSLHEDGPISGGARLPDGARSLQLASAPVAPLARHRARRAQHPDAARTATFVMARVAQPSAAPDTGHPASPVLHPRPQRTRRPASAPPAQAPAPVQAGDTPPDQPSPEADASTTTAVAAATAPAQPPVEAPPATTTAPSKVDAATAPPPVPAADDDSWAAGPCGWHDRRRG
jgi:DNA-directed RNA polymerase specialized sigma24 family protein